MVLVIQSQSDHESLTCPGREQRRGRARLLDQPLHAALIAEQPPPVGERPRHPRGTKRVDLTGGQRLPPRMRQVVVAAGQGQRHAHRHTRYSTARSPGRGGPGQRSFMPNGPPACPPSRSPQPSASLTSALRSGPPPRRPAPKRTSARPPTARVPARGSASAKCLRAVRSRRALAAITGTRAGLTHAARQMPERWDGRAPGTYATWGRALPDASLTTARAQRIRSSAVSGWSP